MSGQPGTLPPQAIVLAGTTSSKSGHLSNAQMEFRVSLGGVHTAKELAQAIATEMMFPHDASGLDALLDLMSDLDWFGNEAGYVVQVDGVDVLAQRDPKLLTQFVGLLPNLCDRWRSRQVPFQIILRCHRTTRHQLRGVIDAANAELREAARQPWLGDVKPAAIIECDE